MTRIERSGIAQGESLVAVENREIPAGEIAAERRRLG